jgi:hypothetical protein
MRRRCTVVVLGLAMVGGVLVGAAPAGARVSAKPLCDVLADAGTLPDVSSGDSTEEQADDAAKLYKRLSKADAPKQVKKALRTLARSLRRIADGDDPEDVFGDEDDARKYSEAFATFSNYQLDECIGDSLEDIEDQLPPGVTLPSLPD